MVDAELLIDKQAREGGEASNQPSKQCFLKQQASSDSNLFVFRTYYSSWLPPYKFLSGEYFAFLISQCFFLLSLFCRNIFRFSLACEKEPRKSPTPKDYRIVINQKENMPPKSTQAIKISVILTKFKILNKISLR